MEAIQGYSGEESELKQLGASSHCMSMCRTLVILESPAKCGKIERFLGACYVCIASYGHIRELKGLDAIKYTDDGDVVPEYTIIASKAKQVARLKAEAARADSVILATDDDREGEAIAWHVREVLGLPDFTPRIVFHEITRNAVEAAMRSPRTINMDVVRAQQAREIIDLTVGFKVSPVLWDKLSKQTKQGLSAGRCQTPALRLVHDNAEEVAASPGEMVYAATGTFTAKNLPFKLDTTFADRAEVEAWLSRVAQAQANGSYVFSRGLIRRCYDEPPRPFTTSTMQQAASSRLKMSPKRSMKVCQSLYEGGHITYMRTDSDCMAPEFVTSAVGVVRMKYGDPFVASEPRLAALSQRKGTPGAQEAHEAIRPTHVGRGCLGDTVDRDESRLYALIWNRAVGACMAPAEVQRMKAAVSASQVGNFVYKAENEVFPGWHAVEGTSVCPEAFNLLISIKNRSPLPYHSVVAEPTLRGTKSRYTEASLVKELESRGIGRPSTFASLVSKIQERGYVKVQDVPGRQVECRTYRLEGKDTVPEIYVATKVFGTEKKKLVIQALGRMVISMLVEHFDDLFRYGYTSDMESKLDGIAARDATWSDVCKACDADVTRLLAPLGPCTKSGIRVDDQHTFMVGRYGPVLKHVDKRGKTTFKGVRKDLDLDMDKLQNGEYTLSDLVAEKQAQTVLGKHEGKTVTLKSGRYGPYVEWNGIRRSVRAEQVEDGRTLDLGEAVLLLTAAGERGVVRPLDAFTAIRSGPKGDYVFHKKPRMKKPVFYSLRTFITQHGKDSYKTCDIALVKTWLKKEHKHTLSTTVAKEG